MGRPASDVETSVIEALRLTGKAKRVMIMLKNPPQAGSPGITEHRFYGIPDGIATFDAVDRITPATDIQYVIARLPNPMEYGLDVLTPGAEAFGVFTDAGASTFRMDGFLALSRGVVEVDSIFGEDTKYIWDERHNKMRGMRADGAFGATANPLVRDRAFAVEQDLRAVFPTPGVVKSMMDYTSALFEAANKFLSTDRDDEVFNHVVARRRFPYIERGLRARVWDLPVTSIELAARVLQRNADAADGWDEPARTAMQGTLRTLADFLTGLHHEPEMPRTGKSHFTRFVSDGLSALRKRLAGITVPSHPSGHNPGTQSPRERKSLEISTPVLQLYRGNQPLMNGLAEAQAISPPAQN